MRRAKTAIVAAAGIAVLLLAGCGGTVAEPTADEQFAQAEELYFAYREATNGVLAVIDDGPWKVEGYGMTPSGAGCGDGWKFDLGRSTAIDPADVPARRTAVADHLVDAGFEVEGMDLGDEDSGSGDVIVREQGVYSLLMVTFVADGSVLVTATTPCTAGDRYALSDRLFGEKALPGQGYLPTEESPSDPLFFGITPGDPQFSSAG